MEQRSLYLIRQALNAVFKRRRMVAMLFLLIFVPSNVGNLVRDPMFRATGKLMSLRAVFDRGGFNDSAKVDNVLHIHWEDSGSYAARVVDLKAVLESGDVRNDIILAANDIVFVPKTRIANANL